MQNLPNVVLVKTPFLAESNTQCLVVSSLDVATKVVGRWLFLVFHTFLSMLKSIRIHQAEIMFSGRWGTTVKLNCVLAATLKKTKEKQKIYYQDSRPGKSRSFFGVGLSQKLKSFRHSLHIHLRQQVKPLNARTQKKGYQWTHRV